MDTGNQNEAQQRVTSFFEGQDEIYGIKVGTLMNKLLVNVRKVRGGEKLTSQAVSTYDKTVPCASNYTRWFMLKHGKEKMHTVPVRSCAMLR